MNQPAGQESRQAGSLPRPRPRSPAAAAPQSPPEKTSSFQSLRRAVRAALVARDFRLRVSSASSTSICVPQSARGQGRGEEARRDKCGNSRAA